jgi:hypothetical protein
MRTSPVTRTAVGISLLLVPVLNLISALFAAAAVKTDPHAEILAITAHPTKFYAYAITQLVGAYLFVPAIVGVKNLMRERAPRWAEIAGGALILGLLVAIGDSAVELVTWQMGVTGADPGQMTALLSRYDNTSGAAIVYMLGGITIMVSTVIFTIGLIRTRAVPIWAALSIAVAVFANIAGYASGSQAMLVGSALVLLAGFGRVAATVFAPSATQAVAPAHSVAMVAASD